MEKILLGNGIVTVGGTPIGLTRGGGSFDVEREYREIVAISDPSRVVRRLIVKLQNLPSIR